MRQSGFSQGSWHLHVLWNEEVKAGDVKVKVRRQVKGGALVWLDRWKALHRGCSGNSEQGRQASVPAGGWLSWPWCRGKARMSWSGQHCIFHRTYCDAFLTWWPLHPSHFWFSCESSRGQHWPRITWGRVLGNVALAHPGQHRKFTAPVLQSSGPMAVIPIPLSSWAS